MVKVLFVCLGNICRSPTAEGVFRKHVAARGYADRIQAASAGTSNWHVGESPDERTIEEALQHGVDLRGQRGRQVTRKDIEAFDYILAMDTSNLDDLLRLSPAGHEHKIALLLPHAPELGEEEVPDPYYGGPNGFKRVFQLIEAASAKLIDRIERERFNGSAD